MAAPKLTPESHFATGTGALSPVGTSHPLTARIGKYEVEAEMKEGSAVQVLQGLDRDTLRPVTLKVLTDITDAGLQQRFRTEVATAAQLHHPSFITIYELGEHVGLPFAAMQYLSGLDLKTAIQTKRPGTLLEKMLIMWQVAEGVQVAHRGGIPYLGIRPAGIMLAESGAATIQDFGIVRPCQEDRDEYSAPEELSGTATPDSLCDIFAFGLVYYELLAGRHPFLIGDSGGLIIDIPGADPAPLRQLAPECPAELERIVLRALEKRRELRYQSLEDLQFDVEPIFRELKRARAAALLQEVRKQAAEDSLDEAQSMLREVLELDPDSRPAHELRQTLRVQVQRQTAQARVRTLLRDAEQEVAARNFQGAIESLTEVLRLDEANVAARERLEAIRILRDKTGEASRLLAEAREVLTPQHLGEARQKTLDALERDPDTPGGRELLEAIESLRERQEAETEIEHGLANAKSLLLVESFDEAIEVLDALGRKYPTSPKVEHWKKHVEVQKARLERENRLQSELDRARSFIDERRFAAASELLEKLAIEFPAEEQIRELRKEAEASVAKAAAIAVALQRCDEHRLEYNLDAALEVLDAALASYPGEAELVDARAEVAGRKEAMLSAVVVRAALQEVRWLLDKDRPDLAAQFLRDKLAELPGDPTLVSRLSEIEQILPAWERRRLEQDAINRAALLEEKQQWTVALTVLEEALKASPDSAELEAAVERFRERIRDQERQKKLARRIETIRQRMDSGAWAQALSLIESAQREFPGAGALKRLGEEAQAELRRSECETIAADIRQCLSDGDTARAEELLRNGLEAMPSEPALRVLRNELDDARQFQENWRQAQVLFGRAQLEEAETLLLEIAGPDRPEVDALLETLRHTRSAGEHEDSLARSRERAVKLMQDGQFSEAAEVLGYLLSYFPGDPILTRDLQTVREKLGEGQPLEVVAAPPVTAAAAPVFQPPPPAAQPPAPEVRSRGRKSWFRWTVPGMLMLAGAFGLWTWLQRGSSAAPPASVAAPVENVVPAQPQVAVPQPDAAAERPETVRTASRYGASARPNRAEPVRAFVPPAQRPAPSGQVALPLPPGAAAGRVEGSSGALPAGLTQSITAPAPPPSPVRQAAPPPARAAASGGRIEQAEVISRPLPQVPEFIRNRRTFTSVKLEAMIDPTGKVSTVRVLGGDPVLAEAARKAVLTWKYKPAKLNGTPIESKVAIQVDYR
jgi:Protein kinase domain/Gram-negative bacterial TonB protein C-terminal